MLARAIAGRAGDAAARRAIATGRVSAVLAARVASGALVEDAGQARAARVLDGALDQLASPLPRWFARARGVLWPRRFQQTGRGDAAAVLSLIFSRTGRGDAAAALSLIFSRRVAATPRLYFR